MKIYLNKTLIQLHPGHIFPKTLPLPIPKHQLQILFHLLVPFLATPEPSLRPEHFRVFTLEFGVERQTPKAIPDLHFLVQKSIQSIPSFRTSLNMRPVTGGWIRRPSLLTAWRYGIFLTSESLTGFEIEELEISSRSFESTHGLVTI